MIKINNCKRGLRNIVACMLALCIVGCESQVEDGTGAFEDAKTLRTTQSDSIAISAEADALLANAKPELTGNTMPRPKVVIIDPWTAYAKGVEARLVRNETTITSLKGAADNAKIFKKVAALEKENADLRTQMTDYKAAEAARWTAFKASIDQQVDLVAVGLKELTPAVQSPQK